MAEDLARFAARLLRFDPGALIRLRDGQAWSRLPWDVLVCVPIQTSGSVAVDRVISAADGTQRDAQWRGALPPRTVRTVEVLPAAVVRDAAAAAARTLRETRARAAGEARVGSAGPGGATPSPGGVPGGLGEARAGSAGPDGAVDGPGGAADGVRDAGHDSGVAPGRVVGERAVRDALLDHPVITGTSDEDGTAFVVPQRIVQAIVRMGLLSGDIVGVLVAGPWTGLGTRLGSAWYRASSDLTVRPLR